MIGALLAGGVLLLGMVVMAGYAARTLPADARVPLNAGVPEYSVWLPKPAGLAAWVGVGAAAFAAFSMLTSDSLSANWAVSIRIVLLPSVMTVMLAAEAGAVIVARRSAAGQPGAETVAASAASQDSEPSEPPDNDSVALSGVDVTRGANPMLGSLRCGRPLMTAHLAGFARPAV